MEHIKNLTGIRKNLTKNLLGYIIYLTRYPKGGY